MEKVTPYSETILKNSPLEEAKIIIKGFGYSSLYIHEMTDEYHSEIKECLLPTGTILPEFTEDWEIEYILIDAVTTPISIPQVVANSLRISIALRLYSQFPAKFALPFMMRPELTAGTKRRHEDFAGLINKDRCTVTRALKTLRKEGKLL